MLTQQTSSPQQPNNILSFAQSWLRNNRQQPEQAQENLPRNRALYERVRFIADQIEEEKGNHVK